MYWILDTAQGLLEPPKDPLELSQGLLEPSRSLELGPNGLLESPYGPDYIPKKSWNIFKISRTS